MGSPVFIARVRVINDGGTWDSLGEGEAQPRIVSESTRSLDTEPNAARVKVYNLSDDTLGLITGVQSRRLDWTPAQRAELLAAGASAAPLEDTTDGFNILNIEVSWGYADSEDLSRDALEAALSVGWLGQVVESGPEVIEEGLDRVLVLAAQDGGQTLGAAEVVQQAGPTGYEGKAYAAGTRIADILADLVNSAAVAADADTINAQIVEALQRKGLPGADAQLLGGYNATGPARPQIDSIVRALGLRWSIQLGEFILLADGDAIPGLEPIVFSSELANITGKPQAIGDDGLQLPTQASTSATPGRPANVSAEGLDASYVIDSATTRFDSTTGGTTIVRMQALQTIQGAGF